MVKKKGNRGGSRPGAGRKSKYGEPTTPVVIRVPESKVKEFRRFVAVKLAEWSKSGI